MFKEGGLDAVLRTIKRLIPAPLFRFGARMYHPLLAWTGALRYGFPSHKLTVIGVTGTKGKSTTVYMTARILEHAGHPVAAIGSLGYKIREREWPNVLKMTMPGRWKMQKFLREALDAGCTHAVIEMPSEGLAQGRHLGVRIGVAVFTNLHPEHIESHGSFEVYRAAKQILFRACHGVHVVNVGDPSAELFLQFPAHKHVTYGVGQGDIIAEDVQVSADTASFLVGRTRLVLSLGGIFNVYNALAAIAVGDVLGVPVALAREALESIRDIAGRMEWIQKEPFGVVVDYAHTPESLEAVYRTLKPQAQRLVCVLGSAGGGRDAWKRPKFGAIAARYCDRIILTDEDPFDEDPMRIVADIQAGIPAEYTNSTVVMDRKQAIAEAITGATAGDSIVITGKGSETSMALAGGRKIPWSDADIVRGLL